MKRGRVQIHVEELVLHGFVARDRHRIGAAFERELTRLVERDGAHRWEARHEGHTLDGGTFEIGPDMSPRAIGVQLAQTVHTGLGR
jgi:hypothetical protein